MTETSPLSEDQIQGAFFAYVWNKYTELRYYFWHTPNGGFRTKSEAARLKTIGVVAGVADICLAKPGIILWVEFKDHKGTQSDHQKAFQAVQERIGNKYVIVRNTADAIAIFEEFYCLK